MQLDDDQAAWFRSNVLTDFNTEANADVQLIAVDDEEQLQARPPTLPSTARTSCSSTCRPRSCRVRSAPSRCSRLPVSWARSGSRRISDKLGDKVLAPGKVGGAQYFLPDMTLVDVAVYRASKVRDAILHWSRTAPAD